jgi:hypothetical protein
MVGDVSQGNQALKGGAVRATTAAEKASVYHWPGEAPSRILGGGGGGGAGGGEPSYFMSSSDFSSSSSSDSSSDFSSSSSSKHKKKPKKATLRVDVDNGGSTSTRFYKYTGKDASGKSEYTGMDGGGAAYYSGNCWILSGCGGMYMNQGLFTHLGKPLGQSANRAPETRPRLDEKGVIKDGFLQHPPISTWEPSPGTSGSPARLTRLN